MKSFIFQLLFLIVCPNGEHPVLNILNYKYITNNKYLSLHFS